VIELKNGGRIQGELVDSDDESAATYTIKTAGGGHVSVDRAKVARVVPQAKDRVEARETPVQNDVDDDDGGRMTRDEIMAARGMIWYDGKYRTRQHVELLKQAKEIRTTESEWNNRLKRWRRWLTGRRQDRAAEAEREIRAIRDPAAAAGIVEMLGAEQNPAVKRLLIDVAVQIEDQQTLDVLVTLSLYDPNEELRYQCLEYLIESGRPGIIRPYIRELRHPDNVIINRAAVALEEIGNRDAIGPLVNALVTKHKFQTGGGSSDQHAYSFTPSGGTSMNFGGGGPKTVVEQVENRAVLTALVKLSGGVNFGYDREQWHDWLAAQAKANPVDVRRDF
jgi:hypothetical protein